VKDRIMALTFLSPDHPDFAATVVPHNRAVTHTPDRAVAVTSTDDAVAAVRLAREQGLPVQVQATGHGALAPVTSGLLVATAGLDSVRVFDGHARLGAGVRWGAVVGPAAEQGLAPVAGSAPTVGAAGYLLGGGLGPLARSHGFSSDYLVGATVVTGRGDVVDAGDPAHADLLWALRGGKYGLGLVTELRLRLAVLSRLYAGSLFFDTGDIAAAFRGWLAWTADADPRVTTSAAVINFPPFDAVPPPLRGRRLLSVRFAFPGPAAEGEELAAPLRALAPVHLDALGDLPVTDIAKIHNDPTDPAPSWAHGALLDSADDDLATAWLEQAATAPFVAVELRHIGAATRRDVDGGSAVGGRTASYTFSAVGVDPSGFAAAMPAAAQRFDEALGPWLSAENNVNFAGQPGTPQRRAACWSADVRKRLDEVRRAYDPDGVFATPH
jgi:FAD/FMN-containing dehydrogenase